MKATNSFSSMTTTNNTRQTFTEALATPAFQNKINNSLRDPKRANRFIASVTAAVNANPMLAACTSDSILTCAFQGEALELSPSPALGHYYMIPYRNNRTGLSEARFQLGVNGVKQLAMRSGLYKDLDAIEVREGEYIGRDEFSGKPRFHFISDDVERESRPVIGYLAYYELLNGFRHQVYFPREKVINWADRYSQAFDKELWEKYNVYMETGEGMTEKELRACSSPWYGEGFDGMALKTVIRQVLKGAPMSIEMLTGVESDTEYMNDFGGNTDVAFNGPEVAVADTVEAEAVEEIEEVVVEEKKPAPKQSAAAAKKPAKKSQAATFERDDEDISSLFETAR